MENTDFENDRILKWKSGKYMVGQSPDVECPECGYPIPRSLEETGTCPECGTLFVLENII